MRVFLTPNEKLEIKNNCAFVVSHPTATTEQKEWAKTCKQLKNLYGLRYLHKSLTTV